MSLLEASKNCNDPDAYKKSRVYWSKINPTINGMLGGFGRINVTDLNGSRQFVHALKKFVNFKIVFYHFIYIFNFRII
jgi:hypothetical protein